MKALLLLLYALLTGGMRQYDDACVTDVHMMMVMVVQRPDEVETKEMRSDETSSRVRQAREVEPSMPASLLPPE